MTPFERSRGVLRGLEGIDVRRELEQSDLPIELATAIADVCEGAMRSPEARDSIIEECAKLCETNPGDGFYNGQYDAYEACAKAVRALKGALPQSVPEGK